MSVSRVYLQIHLPGRFATSPRIIPGPPALAYSHGCSVITGTEGATRLGAGKHVYPAPDVARTGKVGDGKIFVIDLQQIMRIRTGEIGTDAL